MSGIIGTGSTITFATSGLTAQIRSISISGEERAVIDVSHMSTTGFREKIASTLREPPTLEVEALLDPDDVPNTGAVAETVTLTFSDASTLAGTAFITSHDVDIPMEDVAISTFTVQFDGFTGPTWA